MQLTNKFHEDDYDGIVLKIPLWFIEMNELTEDFQRFTAAIKNANRSMFISDHQKNLFELENYADKKKIISKRKELYQEKINQQQKEYDDITNGNIIKLSWRHETVTVGDYVTLNGKTYECSQVSTAKYSDIQAVFQREVKESIKSIEDLKKFSSDNGQCGLYKMTLVDDTLLDISRVKLYIIKYNFGMVGLAFDTLNAEIVTKIHKDGRYSYQYNQLRVDEEGDLFISLNGGVEKDSRRYFKDYKRTGMQLIKQL